MLTPALGIKIISFYRIIHHVFCRAAIQDHTLGAEKLTFCSGESSFRTDGWGINYENLHSLEKAQTNLFSITWELVRTFFLIYLFFLTLLHTCCIDTSFQVLSGISLQIIKSVIAKMNSSGFHEVFKTQ